MIKNQYHFFYPEILETVILNNSLFNQITRVLRLKIKDKICLLDGKGCKGIYEIIEITNKEIKLKLESKIKKELKKQVILIMALLKKDKLEWVIQKAVELGITHLYLFEADNSVVKTKNNGNKLKRWQKIALEALEQSGGVFLPSISIKNSLKDVLALLKNSPTEIYMAHYDANKTLKDMTLTKETAFVVGPEGGLSEEELLLIDDLHKIKIASHILRAETAAICVLSQLNLLNLE